MLPLDALPATPAYPGRYPGIPRPLALALALALALPLALALGLPTWAEQEVKDEQEEQKPKDQQQQLDQEQRYRLTSKPGTESDLKSLDLKLSGRRLLPKFSKWRGVGGSYLPKKNSPSHPTDLRCRTNT